MGKRLTHEGKDEKKPSSGTTLRNYFQIESRREILNAAGWNGPPSRWQSSAATLSSAFLLALAAPQTLQPHPFSTGHREGEGRLAHRHQNR
ncbi:hypothetical protein TrVFT333_004661 [Trichoderma virens FT-333]|nr:hypothetical protein TrVFT333_004661 [Trichoderma virens FT-333]